MAPRVDPNETESTYFLLEVYQFVLTVQAVSADDKLMIYSYFSQTTDFDISHVKAHFLEKKKKKKKRKKKKNISKCCLLKFLPCMLSVSVWQTKIGLPINTDAPVLT